MNKREKGIRAKPQNELAKDTQTQLDRLFDDLVSALKNLKLSWSAKSEEEGWTKIAAAQEYLVEALEKAVYLRYASKEVNHRYWRVRRQDREKAERLKLHESSPAPFTAPMPENFFEVGEDGKRGEA